MIPSTYREVLIALRDNPDGLSTSQIFKWCTDKGASELKNSTVVSYIINTLRDKKRVVSVNVNGMRIHKITEVGIGLVTDVVETLPIAIAPVHSELDAAIAIIKAHVSKQPVENLSLKQEVLAKLQAIVSDDISKVLADIRRDLMS